MSETFVLDTVARFVGGTEDAEIRISNAGTGTIYYDNERTVSSSSNDGSIAAGASATRRVPTWISASTLTPVTITRKEHAEDSHNVHGYEGDFADLTLTSEASINVQHSAYGAHPSNSAAVNAVAIQAALDAATAGQAVYFPPGDYSYSTGLTVSQAKVILVGSQGAGIDTQSVKLTYTGVGTAITFVVASAYSGMAGIHLLGTGTRAAAKGVVFGDPTSDTDPAAAHLGGRLDRCVIENFQTCVEYNEAYLPKHRGGEIRNFVTGVLVTKFTNDLLLEDIHFYGVGVAGQNAVKITRGTDVADKAVGNTRIVGNMFEAIANDGVCVRKTGGVHTEISGNVFGDGAYGIVIEDSVEAGYVPEENDKTRIVNNAFQAQITAAIQLNYGPSATTHRTVIEGNFGHKIDLRKVGNIVGDLRSQFSELVVSSLQGGGWISDKSQVWLPSGGNPPNMVSLNPNFKYGAAVNWTSTDAGTPITPTFALNGPSGEIGLDNYFGNQYSLQASCGSNGSDSNFAYSLSDAVTTEATTAYTLAVWVPYVAAQSHLKVQVYGVTSAAVISTAPLASVTTGERLLVHCYFYTATNTSVKIRLSTASTAAVYYRGVMLARGIYLPGELGFEWTPKATSAPATGNWLRGDRVAHSAPAAATAPEWICTVAGAPGTWVASGLVGTQQSSITDASVAHALNATFSDTEAEAALDALGAKVNLILDVLDSYGFTA